MEVHRLRRAAGGLSPGMRGAVEDARRFVGGQRPGVGLLLLQPGQLEDAYPLHVLLAEGRVLHDVRQQLQRLGQRLGQAVEVDVDRLQPGAGPQVDGKIFDLLGQLRRGARLGALVDRVGDELGQPWLVLGVGVDTVEEAHVHRHQRHRVVLHDQHARAVLQPALHRHRRLEVRLHRQRRRNLGAERFVRHQRRHGRGGGCWLRLGRGAGRRRRRGRLAGLLRLVAGLRLLGPLRRHACVGRARNRCRRRRRGLRLGGSRALPPRGHRLLLGARAGAEQRCHPHHALHRCAPCAPAEADFGAGTTSSWMRCCGRRNCRANCCAACGVTAR